MTPQVSIIIAIAPYHQEIAENAIAAASLQTVPCTVLTAYDEQGRGPGYVHNVALSRVETDFTVFLNADDTIDRTFAERCLAVWRPDHYVYSDWMEGAVSKTAPDCPYVNKTWHPVTTLIPTDWIHRVGGFDETLLGAEDSHLYLKLLTSGCCGIHLKEPLFHYGSEGRRARQFMQSPAFQQTMERFTLEFGGRQMSCCGDTAPETPLPEGNPGDVIVQAIWGGNRVQRGPVTGRMYERTGNGKMTKVDPRDQQARPDLWKLVSREPIIVQRPAAVVQQPIQVNIPATANGVGEVAAALWNTPAPIDLDKMIAVKPAAVKPDVGALARLISPAKRA